MSPRGTYAPCTGLRSKWAYVRRQLFIEFMEPLSSFMIQVLNCKGPFPLMNLAVHSPDFNLAVDFPLPTRKSEKEKRRSKIRLRSVTSSLNSVIKVCFFAFQKNRPPPESGDGRWESWFIVNLASSDVQNELAQYFLSAFSL